MPGITGGDNCSKEYAPHMWIGDHFIASTEKKVKVGEWSYRIGRTKDEQIVCERYKAGSRFSDPPTEISEIPITESPKEVHDLARSISFAKSRATQQAIVDMVPQESRIPGRELPY